MTRSHKIPTLTSEFDDFLFAPIYVEKSGLMLSVVSALARLDLDPWDETADLAGMPQAMATERLASFIKALPDRPPANEDLDAIVYDLIARLHVLPISNTASGISPPALAISTAIPARLAFCLAIVLALLMGSLALAANQQPPDQNLKDPAQVANSPTPQKTMSANDHR